MQNSYHLLRRLGMRSNYSGYHYLAKAVNTVAEAPGYLHGVTSSLYVNIGDSYGVSGKAVESALRVLVNRYWAMNSGAILSEVLGYPMYDKPTSTELIAMLADYLSEHPE